MENKVVVAGWGQVTQPKELSGPASDPMGLMAEAAVRCAQTAGTPSMLKDLDGIMVVKIVSRHYASPAEQLAEKISASPRLTYVSPIGGNSPQMLVNMAAGKIARGELDAVLIAGAETYVQRDKNDKKIKNALFKGVPEGYQGDDLIGSTSFENRHGIEHPLNGFPLFETALWAQSGLDLASYLKKIGAMWEKFSITASENPYAWSRSPKNAQEIVTPGKNNRMVCFPYTKFMNSFVTVDQGAAVILMSEEKAGKYKKKNRQPVYFSGGGFAQDRQRFMVEKSDFTLSPPLKDAVDKALTRSKIKLSEIECFDLYSCFPCAVSIAKKMIGIKDDDPRPLTLTGGLGFFGGPGNNYSLHSIATLAEQIAAGRRTNGLITALGWFMHKHAAGVYSSEPLNGDFQNFDLEDQKNPFSGAPPVKIQTQASGKGKIETYTVLYDRNNEPQRAVIYGRNTADDRFIAVIDDKPDIQALIGTKSRVGVSADIRFDPQKNINTARLT